MEIAIATNSEQPCGVRKYFELMSMWCSDFKQFAQLLDQYIITKN